MIDFVPDLFSFEQDYFVEEQEEQSVASLDPRFLHGYQNDVPLQISVLAPQDPPHFQDDTRQAAHYDFDSSASNFDPPSAQEDPLRRCHNCGVGKSPLWRRDRQSNQPLCNACGLYYASYNAHRPIDRHRFANRTFQIENPELFDGGVIKKKRKRAAPRTDLECVNCGSSSTPLWRKDEAGEPLCNACGLYWKLHKQHKPAESTVPSSAQPKLSRSATEHKISTRPSGDAEVARWAMESIQEHRRGLLALQSTLRPDIIKPEEWHGVLDNLSHLYNDVAQLMQTVTHLHQE